jgi:hypothetical protein
MLFPLKRLLQCTLIAALLVAPMREFAAADLPDVNMMPRFALVIGNGKYSEVPLKNAPNDAKAIADHLTRMGFDVTLKVDATRAEMIESSALSAASSPSKKAWASSTSPGTGRNWRGATI